MKNDKMSVNRKPKFLVINLHLSSCSLAEVVRGVALSLND